MFGETKKELRKRNSDLEGLIKLLKLEKKEGVKLCRKFLDYCVFSTVEFLSKKKIIRGAYLFLGNQGNIIAYTPALLELLGREEYARGGKYYALFEEPCRTEIKSALGKSLLGDEEKTFNYNVLIESKKKKLIIKKGEPYYIEIDLPRKFREERQGRVRLFTPLEFQRRPFFSFSKHQNLTESLDDYEKSLREIYPELIKGGWTADEIDNYLLLHGAKGLVEHYGKRKNND